MSASEPKYMNTIAEALDDFRQGKFVIVVDDEDRENEGDFIIAAEKITAVEFCVRPLRSNVVPNLT